MTDKTAIEKARADIDEAWSMVQKLCKGEVHWHLSIPADENNDPDIVIARGLSSAREALAAIDAEKPADDAREVARIVHEECFVDISQTTSTPSRSLIWDIDTAAHVVKSFAVSYHAEQCKACPCGRLGIYLKEEVYLCTRPKQDCHARSNGLCLNALRCLPLPEAPIV
jgi:hypothetical protein